MRMYSVEWLAATIAKGGFSAKMVCNEDGAIFFPASQQHREQKVENVSYEDDYAGNAVAAMLAPQSIEIRYHRISRMNGFDESFPIYSRSRGSGSCEVGA